MQHLSKGVEVYRCAASGRVGCEHAHATLLPQAPRQHGLPRGRDARLLHSQAAVSRGGLACQWLGGLRSTGSVLSRLIDPCRPTCPYNSQWKSGGYFGDHMNWLYSESGDVWGVGVLASPRRPAAAPAVWCDPDVLEHSNGRLVKCTSEPQAPDAYCFTSAETNWCGAASQDGGAASQHPVTLPLPLFPGRTTPCSSCARGSTIGSGRSR